MVLVSSNVKSSFFFLEREGLCLNALDANVPVLVEQLQEFVDVCFPALHLHFYRAIVSIFHPAGET